MSGSHQLFVGRLPRDTRSKDMEDVFYRYGKMTRCDIKQGLKMAYGFVEYEDRRDAEDAIRNEHGRDFQGARIVVEWARGPKDRPDPSGGGGGFRDERRGGGRGYGRDYHERERSDYRRSRRDDYDKRYSRSPSPRAWRRSYSRSPPGGGRDYGGGGGRRGDRRSRSRDRDRY